MPWQADVESGDFTHVGVQAVDLLGYPLEQWYDKNFWASHIHPDDRDAAVSACFALSRTASQFELEYRMIAASGRIVWVYDLVTCEHEDGRPISLRGFLLDITERKLAEQALQLLRQQLAHVSRISTMGELAASLAHELNQPLAVILTSAEAARRLLDAGPHNIPDVKDILADIVQSDNRASEVIRRMRALLVKGELEFAALDLDGVIRDVVSLMHSDAILNRVRVSLELDEGLPRVRGDKVQLQQVVLNVMLNAFDAMAESSTGERSLVIGATRNGGRVVRIAVRDTGIGLVPEQADRVFDAFYTTKRDGLGMGLSISRSIITAHGGELWAENNRERGATFYFTVPIYE